MPKVTYDVSDVEDIADLTQAPVGIYRAKVVSIEAKQSSNDNAMLEVRYNLTHDASGKKLATTYGDIWDYPILDHDHPFVQARLKEFLAAFGLKPKGTLDTDKLIGKSVQIKLKSDTDQDGDYRPRVGKTMALASADEAEGEDDEPEAEAEPEGDAEAEIDLDELDRTELKKLIKEQELGSLADLGITKATTDDEIRGIIAEALGGDDEEPEPEDDAEPEPEEEPEPEADDGDGYDEMSIPDLKKELKERELPTGGAKAVLIKRLRKDDEDSPF